MWILPFLFVGEIAADSVCDLKKCHRNRVCERGRCRRPTARTVCDLGYIPNASGDCVMNPCIGHACHNNANCNAVPKEDDENEYEAVCQCKDGYIGDGTVSLV